MIIKKLLSTALIFLIWISNADAIDEIVVTADHIEHQEADFKQTTVNFLVNQSAIHQLKLSSQLTHPALTGSVALTLSCEVPDDLQDQQWACKEGDVTSPALNIPFSLHFNHLNNSFGGELQIQQASFSDESGLHAAEDLAGNYSFKLSTSDQALTLTHHLNWTGGEMYWEPFYLEGGGHALSGQVRYDNESVYLDNTQLALKDVGLLKLDGEYDLHKKQFARLDAKLPAVDLKTAFPLLFKPFLQNSVLQEADLSGQMAFDMSLRDGALKAFDVRLDDVSIEDEQHHFGFSELSAHIPWDYDAKKTIEIAYSKGHLFDLSLGAAKLNAEVNRYAWTAPLIELPILDGALILKGISAARLGGLWYWHLGADIQNLSMPQLSQAFGWPTMQGDATVHIPQVTYSNQQLNTNGEIVFEVFDGSTRVTELSWQSPFGEVSSLQANVQVQNLDLGEFTNTFSFGSIEGRLDGHIKQLHLQNWEPIAFDANFVSSPGKYRKKISQRAVENISALGGAGAVAAIQRSVLRFFEAFNYRKIGLSCLLTNGVCQMAGLPAEEGGSTDSGYVIVKGSGIPAITVKGYNHAVGWDELISRVKRVTDENSQAVVQ